MRASLRLVLVGVLMTMPAIAMAQEVRPLTGYRISSWMEEDGVPSGSIWALAQDGNGFLWIGSDAGLVRFDGARFRTWQELGGPALPKGAVRALTVADDGALWVAFSGPTTFARIRDRELRTFDPLSSFADAQVASLLEDREALWAATSKGLLRFTGETWVPVPVGDRGEPIVGLSLDGARNVYVATNRAVFRRAAGAVAFDRLADTQTAVQGFAASRDGHLWATDRNAGFRPMSRAPGATRSIGGKGYRLLFDSRGNLWVATYGQGVWQARFNPTGELDRVQSVTDFQGLSNNVVLTLLEDRNGNIWAGTTAGLNRLAPQRVAPVPNLDGVTGVATTGDAVWANAAEGLTRLVRANGEWLARPVPGEAVHAEAMHADHRGGLWVATDAGLERWTGAEPAVRRERVSTSLRHVRSIASGDDGTVWLLDTRQGLHTWKDGRLAPSPLAEGLRQRRAASLYVDRASQLWFAIQSQSMVGMVDRSGQFRVYAAPEGYAAGFARMFFEDAEGALWVAGSLGLARRTDGAFATLKRDERLPLDSLTAIVQDPKGQLWLGTAAGILRMTSADFTAAAAGRWDDVSVATFDAGDGIAGTTGWVGQPSAARSSDGRLWFLTVTGMSAIDPAALQDTTPAAPVRVEVVALDDRHVPASDGLKVPPDVSRLQIEFTIPTLSPAQQTRFRYRLDGFDSAWINSGRLRTAIYTNLPPRDYRFRVQLQDSAGVWHEQAAEWTFSVEPAIYQTAWFAALCAVMVLGAGWAAWRFRVTQMRRQLAIVHGERARLSREIHDTLLQSLVGVALQCDALANAPDHQSATSGLAQLRRRVEGYVRECRQSLWNLRSPMLEEKDLPAALRDIGDSLAGAVGMIVDLQLIGAVRRTPGRVDEQLLRVAQEAIANAARHSGASRIEVTLDYGTDAVSLTVADDGRGFEPADPLHAASGHWGLVGMQERARAVNGTFAITSRPGAGTRVRVSVPAPRTETTDAEIPDHGALHGRSPDRPRGHRPDHQPAA